MTISASHDLGRTTVAVAGLLGVLGLIGLARRRRPARRRVPWRATTGLSTLGAVSVAEIADCQCPDLCLRDHDNE